MKIIFQFDGLLPSGLIFKAKKGIALFMIVKKQ